MPKGHFTRKKRDPIDRFMDFVSPEPNSGCWLWMGGGTRYGHFAFTETDKRNAHRMAWEFLRGPIPEGLVVDHKCKNIVGVNPHHLEPVTQKVNVDRSSVSESAKKMQAAKITCRFGHPFDKRTERQRVCSICRREQKRKSKARRKLITG